EFDRQNVADVEAFAILLVGEQAFLMAEIERGRTGDAGAHAQHDLAQFRLEMLDEARDLRTRPHQTHLAAHDIEQLRQFVYLVVPQYPPDGRDPVIIRSRDRRAAAICAMIHGTELEDGERTSITPDTLLLIEDWPT